MSIQLKAGALEMIIGMIKGGILHKMQQMVPGRTMWGYQNSAISSMILQG